MSGATAANWVAKTANLLVDGLGQPGRIGVLLPLHWQGVVLLLAGIVTGATVVLADRADELTGCSAAFVLGPSAGAALDAGVGDVLALSGTPLGSPLRPGEGEPGGMILDYAVEVPSYADHYGGSRPAAARIEVAGRPVPPGPLMAPGGRLLTILELADPVGAASLVQALRAGAGLVLMPAGDAAVVARAERVTHTAGVDVEGLPRLA